MFRQATVRQFWFVRFRSVAVCSGVVRQLRSVTFRHVQLSCVMLWQFWWGRARYGVVGNGEVGQGSAVMARRGRVWFGAAR